MVSLPTFRILILASIGISSSSEESSALNTEATLGFLTSSLALLGDSIFLLLTLPSLMAMPKPPLGRDDRGLDEISEGFGRFSCEIMVEEDVESLDPLKGGGGIEGGRGGNFDIEGGGREGGGPEGGRPEGGGPEGGGPVGGGGILLM